MSERKMVRWEPVWTPEEEKQIEAIDAEIGRRISTQRALREELGLTQEQFAQVLGVTQSNVSKIETKGEPKLSVLRKLFEQVGGTVNIVAEVNGVQRILPF